MAKKTPEECSEAGQKSRLKNDQAKQIKELGRTLPRRRPSPSVARGIAIGKRAKLRREQIGLTINELAVKMNRTYQCIHGMEREGVLSMDVLLEWSEALNANPTWLVFGKGKRDLVRRIREEIGE